MQRRIVIERLTAAAFAAFGDVIELRAAPDAMINRGLCARHHDLAALAFIDARVPAGPDGNATSRQSPGRAGISLFDATPYTLPHVLDLMERHPLGSQAFLPMSPAPFLVITAEDGGGHPVRPRAWITDGRQGVNYHRGTWHGVLTPLFRPALFAVVDRIGAGDNLQEAVLDPPFEVVDHHALITELPRA